jgi:hypothetical protein
MYHNAIIMLNYNRFWMNRVLYFSIPVLVLLIAFNPTMNKSLFGHTFSGDESASFLTKVEMIKIKSQLAEDQLSNNVTLAKEHAEDITETLTANDTEEISERNPRLATQLNSTLTDFGNAFESQSPSQSEITAKVSNITDLLAEVVSARIDNEQLNNVTVKALVLNDLLGESLGHYSSALGMEENGHSENTTSVSNSTDDINNESASVVDEAEYQSAQSVVSRAIEIFNEIKPESNTNSTQLEDSLSSIKERIDSKAHFDEIDTIIDEKTTPLLNGIFKLSLAEEGGEHAEEGGGEHAEEGGGEHAEEESAGSPENETHD